MKIDLVFDQTGYVVGALRALLLEAGLGAALTGLMVLLFLREWRSAAIVVVTIPFALLGATVGLWLTGQTINIMTLGGLALAVGMLVDEATVVIESVHAQRARGLPTARAVVEAARQTSVPRLLATLCIWSVFLPSLFMGGAARQLFVPLSLAVAFAMLTSYMLSSTAVPVLAVWLLRSDAAHRDPLVRVRPRYLRLVETVLSRRMLFSATYVLGATVLAVVLLQAVGADLFPRVDSHQLQLRLDAPTGTRVERTEEITLRALDTISDTLGHDNVAISTAFIGVQPPAYPINSIYLFTSGQHEALLTVALKPSAPPIDASTRERLRQRLAQRLPNVQLAFEPADIISQVMSLGASAPIEVAVQAVSLPAARAFAEKLRAELQRLPFLRDLRYAQPLDYPTAEIRIDRDRAGQFGLTMNDVARSLVPATASSRFSDPNFGAIRAAATRSKFKWRPTARDGVPR